MLEAIKEHKWNIFVGMLLLLAVPMIPYITSNDFKSGILVLFAIFGSALAFLCFNNAKVGFYITLSTVITVRWFERLYGQEIQVGAAIDFMLICSLIGTMLHKNRKGSNPISYLKEPLLVIMYIQFAYSMMEGLNPNGSNKDTVIIFFRLLLRYLMFAILTTVVMKKKEDVHFFFKYWLGLSTVSAVYGCIQEWFGLMPWEWAIVMASPEKLATTLIQGHLRIFSTMTDPAVFGVLMACGSVLCIILLTASLNIISFQKKILIGIALLFHLMALGYSGTRTGYVIIPAGLLLFLLVNLHKRNTLITAMACTVIGGAILFGPFYGNATINRVRSAFVGTDDASLNVREINRHSIQPYIHTHPIGGGLFTCGGEGRAYNPGHPLAGFPPDSGFLRTALELGWPMLIVVMFFYFLQMSTCIGNYFRFSGELDKLLAIAAASMTFEMVISMYAQESGGLMESAFFINALTGIVIKSKYL
ncbi:O-antigen ligase family protein [Chitinophaga sp. Hz27]|uniref:O-antigen ligase family protein n=1 Tax=Chitinophaga sp. Hz27 TaxID=3347169 RepID=UPI0035D55E55